MYNLLEYSDNYSKASGSLWQYYRDQPSLNDNDVINKFPGNRALFNFKQKIIGETADDGTKDVKIMAPSKLLINFWGALEML